MHSFCFFLVEMEAGSTFVSRDAGENQNGIRAGCVHASRCLDTDREGKTVFVQAMVSEHWKFRMRRSRTVDTSRELTDALSIVLADDRGQRLLAGILLPSKISPSNHV